MTLHMDVEERKCECGQPAVKINRCDFREVAHCGAPECVARGSKEITEAARASATRLQIFDAINPHVDQALGHAPPTDRVLAVAYGLLDAASAIVCALMRASNTEATKNVVDDWVFGAVDVLGRRLAPHSEPPDPKH